MDLLNKPIGWIIKLCYKIIPNYALALLLFAIVMKVLLFPFGIKQQKNMLRQAKLRPKEMAIRKRYAGRDDKVTQQKMQQEVMKLYQEENYNPASGCLPLILQLVILFAVYAVMRSPLTYINNYSNTEISNLGIRVVELYHEEKITIDNENVKKQVAEQAKKIKEGENLTRDESLSDVKSPFNANTQIELIRIIRDNDISLFVTEEGSDTKLLPAGTTKEDLPNFTIFGGKIDLSEYPSMNNVNWMLLVPVLTFVFTFGSMKLTKKLTYQPATQQSADVGCSMKIMDYAMPLMSTFITFSVPAIIAVYWIYNNVLSTAQQFVLKLMYPIPVFTEEEYKAAEKEMNKGIKQPKKKTSKKAAHRIDLDEDAVTEKEKTETKMSEGSSLIPPAALKDESDKENDK